MTPADPARRHFIRILSGGIVLPALPLLGGCQVGMPDEAVSAWRSMPSRDTEIRRWALSHALLAPNPHNLQPWTVDLSVPDRITLLYDRARTLPETDPYYRQLIIGCGAFLELLMQALAARGQAATLTPFPQGEFTGAPDERPVATVALNPGLATADPLFAQVRRRHTHRMPFDSDKPLPTGVLEMLIQASRLPQVDSAGTQEPALRQRLRDIAARAWEIEVRTPRVMMESALLFRVGEEEILRHRDGISLTGVGVAFAKAMGWMTPEKIVDPSTSGFRQGLELGLSQARSAMAWTWLTTAGNTRAQQLEAGRAYVRLHLKATELGVALQPMSQVLQEYPEMQEMQHSLHRTLGIDARVHTVQMLARLGYASGAEPSPRRALDTLIKT